MRFAALLAALLVVCPLAARTTASLGGTALPNTLVTVASPSLQGTRSTVAGEGGTYLFPALPPGEYDVRFELPGFETVNTTARLHLAQTTRVDAVMRASETITVTGAAPVVTPEISTSLTLQTVERLPVLRNQLATSQLAPGVIGNVFANGQLQISGGPGYDNLVLVNGVVVTENTRGQMRPLYVEDAIQETTILTGAISAEYGRFTGGVVNTITRSGGNDLTASVRDSLSNPRWSSQTPAGEEREDTLSHVWEATLGGAVLRDRLWFFTAGRWAKNVTARQTLAVPPASPQLSYEEKNDQKRWEAKLTAQLDVNHNFVASWFGVDTQVENARFNNNIYDAASLTTRDDPESLLALQYHGIFAPSLLLEAQVSRREMSLRSGSTATDPINGTLLLDRANNNARFHAPSLCSVCDEERRDNSDAQLKAHYFLSTTRLGTHDLVAGVDRFEEQRRPNNHQSGSAFSIFVTRAQFVNGAVQPVITPTTANGGGTFIRWTPVLVDARENELQTDSLFVNDRWSLGAFVLSLGARFDRNRSTDADGTLVSEDSRVTPRVAAQYELGRHRFSASYGEYTSRIADSIASSNQLAGSNAAIDFAYRGPAISNVPSADAIRMVLDYFNNQQGGTSNTAANNLRANGNRTIPGYSTYFDGTLASPYVREMSVGYGSSIGAHGFARVDLISRDWRDFYAATVTRDTRRATTPLGIPVDLTLLTNTNDIERTYRGVQLQARWARGRFDTGAHYTWSKLRGNDEGESGTAGAVANIDTSRFYPEFLNYDRYNTVGYLTGDQRHRLRAWLGYDFGSIDVSLLQSFDSALAYSMTGPINTTRYTGAPANPGYNAVPNGLYYFSDRGGLRVDDIHTTDLAVRYSRGIFFAQADVLNVFDNDGLADPLRIGTTVTTASTAPNLQPFNPFTEAPVAGVHYQPAANFGEALNDLAYQRPRTVRVAVGVRF
jgi:hypothetical protein